MDLTEEYKRQSSWRDWISYVEKLPIDKGDTILDLGCSIGSVTGLLAKKALRVIGIDNNPELLKEANRINLSDNVTFVLSDLLSIKKMELPSADGIWTSFVPAYFPDFFPVLLSWLKLLKPGGWIGLVEMSDLFAHEPLNPSTREVFQQYYERQYKNRVYDFKMGEKLKDFVLNSGLSIVHEEDKYDKELAFTGPADDDILKAWETRFERMIKFKEYFGNESFSRIKNDFLDSLKNQHHITKTIVKFIIARKEMVNGK
jgi:ubiquinone/menaquinone biosynthesis C-methylase UbiE